MDGYASNPGDLNWDALKQLGDVTVYPRTSDAEKVERAKDADIILINKVQMDAETIAKLPRLKYIGVQLSLIHISEPTRPRLRSRRRLRPLSVACLSPTSRLLVSTW